jgi:hypothetical protein
MPQKLYKYREIDDYSLRILTHDELYYADYTHFNDPFELAFEVAILTRPDTEVDLEILQEYKQKIKANIRSCFRPNIGFLSLTERRDDVLMWSHYSQKHTGICLEFDTSSFNDELLKEVTYSSDLYHVQCHLDEKEEGIIVPVDSDDYLIGICNTKNKAWAYEKEWREVRRNSGVQTFNPEGLTGIIFGCRTTDAQKDQVLQVLENRRQRIGGDPSVVIYQAQMKPGKYALDVIDIGRTI